MLWQNYTERVMAGWVGGLAVPIDRGREVTGFAQDDTGGDGELSNGASLRAEYLVCRLGGRPNHQRLPDALTTWFGPPTAA
jgi:3-(3-hydroxy-phenyl)propionate hydroxylase